MLKANCFSLCFKKKKDKKGRDNDKRRIDKFLTRLENELKFPFSLVDLGRIVKGNSTSLNTLYNADSPNDRDMTVTVYKDKAVARNQEYYIGNGGILMIQSGNDKDDQSAVYLGLKIMKSGDDDLRYSVYLVKVEAQRAQPMVKVSQKYKLKSRNIFIAGFFKFEIHVIFDGIKIEVVNMKTKEKSKYEFTEERDSIKIGRDVSSDVVLNSKLISKNHIKLTRVGFGWFISDNELLKSTKNGLWLLIEDLHPISKDMEFILNGRGFVVKEGQGKEIFQQSMANNKQRL